MNDFLELFNDWRTLATNLVPTGEGYRHYHILTMRYKKSSLSLSKQQCQNKQHVHACLFNNKIVFATEVNTSSMSWCESTQRLSKGRHAASCLSAGSIQRTFTFQNGPLSLNGKLWILSRASILKIKTSKQIWNYKIPSYCPKWLHFQFHDIRLHRQQLRRLHTIFFRLLIVILKIN